MESWNRWELSPSELTEVDVDVVVESALAGAQWTIQQAMTECKIQKAELAERLGRPRSFISRMLNGSHNLTVKTLARALAVCGYELTWQYRPIRWGWVKEPMTVNVELIETGAAPAASVFPDLGYSLAA